MSGECAISVLDDGSLLVTESAAMIRVSKRLYDLLCSGDNHPDIEAGEGLVVIRATNGTVRYALGEYDLQLNAYRARKIAGPTIEVTS